MENAVPCLWLRIKVLSCWDTWTTGDNGHHASTWSKHSLEHMGQSQCTSHGVNSAANRKDWVRIKPVAFRSWILLSHWFVSRQLCVNNFWSGMASYLDHVCVSDNTFHIENEIILMMLSVSLVKWPWLVWCGLGWWCDLDNETCLCGGLESCCISVESWCTAKVSLNHCKLCRQGYVAELHRFIRKNLFRQGLLQ